MIARRFRIPEDMLPFAEQLSADQKTKWISEWRHLVWRSPRYVAVYAAVILSAVGFFVRFVPAWQIVDAIWSKIIFAIGELLVAYVLAESAAYGFSRSAIEVRIANALKKEPNQSLQPTAPSGRG